ncbi:MAG: DUF4116 domain-containing protein, partial [Chlamydiae bacterium]|nr:DUF4116 domain-containing protein [Chlamydiota bacterium]
MAQEGWALAYASDELKNDKEVVLAAVAHSGQYFHTPGPLQYASAGLRGDKEVVMAAMTRHGLQVLKYASDALKADKGFVLAAV